MERDWFDMAVAGPEIARVLTPGGVLAGLWNVPDDSVAWGSLVMPERDRATRLDEIRAFLVSRPETATGDFTLPMLTCVLRVQRLQDTPTSDRLADKSGRAGGSSAGSDV